MVHHGKLNLRQPVLASSGSRTSVLTISGVTSEGPYKVPSIRRLIHMVYYSIEICCA